MKTKIFFVSGCVMLCVALALTINGAGAQSVDSTPTVTPIPLDLPMVPVYPTDSVGIAPVLQATPTYTPMPPVEYFVPTVTVAPTPTATVTPTFLLPITGG